MSDRFEGAVRNASGRVQETAGELVGDARTQAGGAYKQAAGAIQENAATFRDVIRSQPLVAALVAAGIGYFLGRLS
jgi:uncharacterized protein YjbJ (UPF0337 family)